MLTDLEKRRRRFDARVSVISLVVVVLAGAYAVFILGSDISSPARLSIISILALYAGIRVWREIRRRRESEERRDEDGASGV